MTTVIALAQPIANAKPSENGWFLVIFRDDVVAKVLRCVDRCSEPSHVETEENRLGMTRLRGTLLAKETSA